MRDAELVSVLAQLDGSPEGLVAGAFSAVCIARVSARSPKTSLP